MSLQEKFDAVRAIITQHNAVIGNPSLDIKPDDFILNIKMAGGTSEERLKAFSYEDILSCWQTSYPVKPVGLAKDIAKVFRGKEEVSELHVSAKKADKMSLRELVEAYDPEDADNSVGKRLKSISKGQKFIVFAMGRTLDTDTSYKLLQEVKQGFEGRHNIDVNGEIKEVYTVGDLPDNFVDENPLYRGRPLRPDGTCDQTNRSWNGVPLNVRQLIRVAIDTKNMGPISLEFAHNVMDMVMDENAFVKLSKRYAQATVEFKKLESMGKLPILKLVLKEVGCANRPFDNAKKVNWTTNPSYTFGVDNYNVFYGNWKK